MRRTINKLIKGKSTKGERKFMELLKKLRIKFRTKVKINSREVDFLIGKYAIEIDGHQQDSLKNIMLMSEGYFPIHIYNYNIDESLIDWLEIIKCQL